MSNCSASSIHHTWSYPFYLTFASDLLNEECNWLDIGLRTEGVLGDAIEPPLLGWPSRSALPLVFGEVGVYPSRPIPFTKTEAEACATGRHCEPLGADTLLVDGTAITHPCGTSRSAR